MSNDFKNKTYMGLIEMLGSEKSGLFIDQLSKDIIVARNDLFKAQSKNSMDMLDKSTHVLLSLAGTVGAKKIYQLAHDVNDQAVIKGAPFPKEDVMFLLSSLEPWINFLSSENKKSGYET